MGGLCLSAVVTFLFVILFLVPQWHGLSSPLCSGIYCCQRCSSLTSSRDSTETLRALPSQWVPVVPPRPLPASLTPTRTPAPCGGHSRNKSSRNKSSLPESQTGFGLGEGAAQRVGAPAPIRPLSTSVLQSPAQPFGAGGEECFKYLHSNIIVGSYAFVRNYASTERSRVLFTQPPPPTCGDILENSDLVNHAVDMDTLR